MRRRTFLSLIISILMVISLTPQLSFAAETPSSGQITGFVPLENDSYYYEGDPMEEDITAKLPKTIDVYIDGSDTSTPVNVRWESVESFDETDFYFYSMKPVWSDSYTLSPELSEVLDVPWITVYKQEPLSEMSEPMVTEDEVPAIYVDEEEAEAEYGEIGASNEDPVNGSDDNSAAFKILKLFADDTYAANETNTDKVYNYLTNTMGLNTAAACGVMTNLNAESAMNPINLENTYNTLFGLTDAEYTSRVDAGKGAYKTKAGKSRNFKTDYCGYGLCQWTSLGRRTNLLNKALGKNVSVGDINMQMEFLSEELNGSYSTVVNTLKSVPNNAQGAYIAAFIFCNSFKVPANTVNTAASRAKTCISSGGYWQKYTGNVGNLSGTSALALSGYVYPKVLVQGKGMTVKGFAISNYNVTKLSANIKDSKGTTKYSASATPGTTVYSLYKFDDDLKFSKLSTGTYTYNISAIDKSGKTVKTTHTFTVKSSGSNEKGVGFCTEGNVQEQPATQTETASTLTIKSYNYPKTLKKGKGFSIKGKVKSNYALRKVTIKVIKVSDSKTKLSTSKSLTGSAKTYDIHKLDSKIKFGRLAKGTYRYKVIGKDKKKSKTLINKVFVVK